MVSSRMAVVAATPQATLIACAAFGISAVLAAQTPTHKLDVSAVNTVVENGTTKVYRGTTQVTSSPAGIDCRSELLGDVGPTGVCTADFPAGTTVTLTATPLFAGTFDGWTGACAGQDLTCELQMTTDLATATRTIAKTYTLTVIGTGNASGRVHSNDFFTQPPIACGIQGTQTFGTCVAEVPAGQTIWLGREEPVNSIAQFAGWSGCANADEFVCRMVLSGPTTIGAGWIAPEIIIGSNGGSGSGKVTGTAVSGAGPFDCTITPTGATGVCSAFWETDPPSNVQLSPTPIGNSVFRGWVSDWCTFPDGSDTCFLVPPINSTPPGQITRRMEVRAVFEILPELALSITAAGSGSGRVAFSPARPDCIVAAGVPNADCAPVFPQGTALTLTADPTGGSTFGGWAGACAGTQPTCALVLNAAAQATARFNPPRPAAELALALLGSLTLSADEQRELDRFGNKDGVFNLGDLLALMSRTGERLSPATMSGLMQSKASGAVRRDGRSR
jgi:large repetitive protein